MQSVHKRLFTKNRALAQREESIFPDDARPPIARIIQEIVAEFGQFVHT